MPGTLGPGVRVFIGFTPDPKCTPEARLARCTTGMIAEGPFPAGAIFLLEDDSVTTCAEPTWRIQVDGFPNGELWCAESLLTPIDDDDADPLERRDELPEEAIA